MSKTTPAAFEAMKARLIANGGSVVENSKINYDRKQNNDLASGLSDPIPKRNARKTLVATSSDEASGKSRIVLRITRHSIRPVDFDNGAGGCKAIIDQCRYHCLIRDDSPEEIDFQFRQQKVKTKAEEGTMIEIESKKDGWRWTETVVES